LTLTRVNGTGPAAFVAYILDISDQRRAAHAQRLLADTADLLASSLDYEATLRDVAALAVPMLADWCAIDLPGPPGHLEPVAVAAESGRHFDRADLALAEELGRRAGTALENARMYSERSTLAQTLIGALRPPAMPPMGGWDAAAFYQPAGRTEEVGGDFYDVIS